MHAQVYIGTVLGLLVLNRLLVGIKDEVGTCVCELWWLFFHVGYVIGLSGLSPEDLFVTRSE